MVDPVSPHLSSPCATTGRVGRTGAHRPRPLLPMRRDRESAACHQPSASASPPRPRGRGATHPRKRGLPARSCPAAREGSLAGIHWPRLFALFPMREDGDTALAPPSPGPLLPPHAPGREASQKEGPRGARGAGRPRRRPACPGLRTRTHTPEAQKAGPAPGPDPGGPRRAADAGVTSMPRRPGRGDARLRRSLASSVPSCIPKCRSPLLSACAVAGREVVWGSWAEAAPARRAGGSAAARSVLGIGTSPAQQACPTRAARALRGRR
jgi:hypothetical protein